MVAPSAHERKTPGRRDHLVPARPRGHDPAGRAAWARPGAAPAAGAGRRRVDRVRLRGVAAAKGHAEARGRADPRRRHRAPGGRDDRAAAEQQRLLPVHLGRQGAGGGHRPLPVRAGGRRGRPAAQRLPVVGHRARALRGLRCSDSRQHDRPGGQPGGGLHEAEPAQGAHGVPAGGRGLLPRRAARRARGRLCHPHPGRGGRLRHARHGDSPARAAQARARIRGSPRSGPGVPLSSSSAGRTRTSTSSRSRLRWSRCCCWRGPKPRAEPCSAGSCSGWRSPPR